MEASNLPSVETAPPNLAPIDSAAHAYWKWRCVKFTLWSVAALAVMWVLAAYVIVPAAWRHFFARHPALNDMPKLTHTKTGIPGDPLNIALIGSEEEIAKIMFKAGWRPTDPTTLSNCLRLVHAAALRRDYETAPVSDLILWGRKQDLAFQVPVKGVGQRHHVRFWQSQELDGDGRPLWIGAATFDTKAGISHTTGQTTHHIAADIDTERDKLMEDLGKTGWLGDVMWMEGFHEQTTGRNGGGDHYHTDGHLVIGVIRLAEENE